MKKIALISVGLIVLLFGCKKEDNYPKIESQTFEVNSSNSMVWKYFSFEKNDTIVVSDPSTSNEWDLAFQRYRIKTNGGKSGSGLGSAASTKLKGQTGFDTLIHVSDTLNFVSDDSVQIAVQQGYATYIVNPALYTWFNMEFAAAVTQIVPTDEIFVVKTGKGKYAKIWIKSYYSATNASGFVTFQYKYQPDGSDNLE
jgi:hypothetical protein